MIVAVWRCSTLGSGLELCGGLVELDQLAGTKKRYLAV
jgi:hypothetical protein